MAKNIGTFTAAGVDLDTSVQSIKGIANLAALSGSSAEQASTAMYQLSQAIASGRVSLQDWRSVVNAGIGGTVFQRALAQTAVKMGTIKDSAVKLSGPMKNVAINGEPFFKSIAATTGKPSWLTSDVLTKTLTQFTGDLTDAQLAAQGFNREQIRAIQQTAKSAELAATQVKTITQVLDVAKETAGSGWAQSFQILFGNFGEAKVLFTAVSNAVNGFINANAKARNKVLGDWKALGGRTILIKAIKETFQDLGAILKPIKLAFRDIFPKHSAHDLLQLTKRFKELADRMRPSAKTADNIRHTFHGLFAAIDIGRQIVSGILSMFKSLFVTLGAGSGGFLSFTAGVGDFIVKLDEALKKGNVFHNFFVKMGVVLGAPSQSTSTSEGRDRKSVLRIFLRGNFQGSVWIDTRPYSSPEASRAYRESVDDHADCCSRFAYLYSAVGRSNRGSVPAVGSGDRGRHQTHERRSGPSGHPYNSSRWNLPAIPELLPDGR
jgi:tape measure domain-containing protein